MFRSRVFWRLFLAFAVLILSALTVLGVLIVHRVERYFLDQLEAGLRTKAVLVREVARGKTLEQVPQLRERVRALREKIITRITLLAADGTVLADSDENPERMENHANRPEVIQARSSGFGMSTRFSKTLGQDMMYVAFPGEEPGQAVAVVRVAVSLSVVQEQLLWLERLVWTAAGVTALATMALAFWLARRVTRPLQELTEGARRIAAGGFGHKVYVSGQDELGTLAGTFNAMSERLADQFAQLEEDRRQLRAILSGMIEGVVALDAEQRILFANDRALELLHCRGDVAIGRKLWEVVRQPALQKLVQAALAGPDPCQEEVTWKRPIARSLTIHAARLSGPSTGAVLVLHDTSELRRLERLRQEFVANVSHELKTPLSVIQACTETLLDGAASDPEHRLSFLETIADQAHRLHALILDLLSLARIESGAEVFSFQEVNLAEAVHDCLDRHRARAEAKSLVLEAVPPADDKVTRWQGDKVTKEDPQSPCHLATLSPCHPVAAWADEEAVGQILDNLVDNAVKYTPQGGRIQVRWRAEDQQVCIEVEDTGIGIPERDLARIFERFYRVDKARSRELGGTGLGLSIVKHLVQAMHGIVSASSQPGKGTTFVVHLPRMAA
jgi:two-component system phosphate regulon sensor histidine kinase PhoR